MDCKKDQKIKTQLEIEEKINKNSKLLNELKNSKATLFEYEAWNKFPKRSDIQQKIMLAVAEYDDSEKNNTDTETNNIDIEKLTPIAFEHYCADMFKCKKSTKSGIFKHDIYH